uniref:Uncharacterized protein n=1 Tax=Oryzias latipes TaxID=8090 RepID=A0A286P9T7_ORYLA|nr:hypothetical protein ORF37-like [Oryzias latipes]
MKADEEPLDVREAALAECALADRGDARVLEDFRNGRCAHRARNRNRPRGEARWDCYEQCYDLLPLHRDVASWAFVSEDPQLAVVIEEIVNTFSPALSVELLLCNVLGSNSESAACLVRYLVGHYVANRPCCGHIKSTLRNMIRWTVLAGFVPCLFLPWKKIRSLGLGLSGKAAVINMVSGSGGPDARPSKRCRKDAEAAPPRSAGRLFVVSPDGLSPPGAAAEAIQEKEAHDEALPRVLEVPLDSLAETAKLLMMASVPCAPTAVVCKIVADWVRGEREAFVRNPVKETELKMSVVTLWGVMKTFEHGRCPVVPECRASSCLAFYDKRTALVTAAVDGVLYRRASVWDSSWSASGPSFSSLAERAHDTVKNWRTLFGRITRGLNEAAARHVYTSAGADRSSLARVADVMLSSRAEQRDAGISVVGNATDRPLLDNLSRALACNQQTDMLGLLNDAELPDSLLQSGACASVSKHKSASVSHSLSKMMASMISEGKEVLLVRGFLTEVTSRPRAALEKLRSECEDPGLLRMAENVSRRLERRLAEREDGAEGDRDPVTELGSDVRLVCSYPSSVSVAHLEETLSIWTNFWRSALSGFSHFNRRHNTIQYNHRDGVRELESGSPVHIFHSALVALLNTSGATFADSLSGRKPDGSLSVSDIMLTKDSLHPPAYGLLLANKLGLRPSDVKSCEEVTTEERVPGAPHDPSALYISPQPREASAETAVGTGR